MKTNNTYIEKTWGYNHPQVYRGRLKQIVKYLNHNITKPDFNIIDWGSDSGWTSVALAKKYTKASIQSVDDGSMYNDVSCIDEHIKYIKEYNIQNNSIYKMTFSRNTWSSDITQTTDVQLLLSIMHWLGYDIPEHQKRDTWDRLLIDIVSKSKYTFIELPNTSNPSESPHMIREWYDGRTEYDTLQQALSTAKIETELKLLGKNRHGKKGFRKIFAIDNKELTCCGNNNLSPFHERKVYE